MSRLRLTSKRPPAPRSLHRALYPSVLTSVGPFLLAHFVQFSVLPLQCFTHCPPLQLHGIFLPFIVSPSLLLYSTNISYIHVLFCLILVHHFFACIVVLGNSLLPCPVFPLTGRCLFHHFYSELGELSSTPLSSGPLDLPFLVSTMYSSL